MDEILTRNAPLLLTLASAAALGLFGWLTHSADQRMKTGRAKDATLELIECARVVVRFIEQAVKPELVARSAGGKLSREDVQILQETALTALKDQVSDQAQKIIKNNGTRIEQAMTRALESAVAETKEAKAEKTLSIRPPPRANPDNVGLAT